jgi:hypothetical protein
MIGRFSGKSYTFKGVLVKTMDVPVDIQYYSMIFTHLPMFHGYWSIIIFPYFPYNNGQFLW